MHIGDTWKKKSLSKELLRLKATQTSRRLECWKLMSNPMLKYHSKNRDKIQNYVKGGTGNGYLLGRG